MSLCITEILCLKSRTLERADQFVALEKLLEKSGPPVFTLCGRRSLDKRETWCLGQGSSSGKAEKELAF